MTDTQLLDFCEAAMKAGKEDRRYANDTMFILGTMSFSISRRDARSFRQLIEAEFHKKVTERLTKA